MFWCDKITSALKERHISELRGLRNECVGFMLKAGRTGPADKNLSSWISSCSRGPKQKPWARQQCRRLKWGWYWNLEELRFWPLLMKYKQTNKVKCNPTSPYSLVIFTNLWLWCWRLWSQNQDRCSRWPDTTQSLWMWRWPIGRCHWLNTARFRCLAFSGSQLMVGSWLSGSRQSHFVPPWLLQREGWGRWCSSGELNRTNPDKHS